MEYCRAGCNAAGLAAKAGARASVMKMLGIVRGVSKRAAPQLQIDIVHGHHAAFPEYIHHLVSGRGSSISLTISPAGIETATRFPFTSPIVSIVASSLKRLPVSMAVNQP